MKKFFLYIMLVLGIAQLNYSCTPETNPPFLAKLGINADSLMNKPFPKVVLNVDSIGLPLNESEFYSLTLDPVHYMRIVSWKKIGNNYIVFFSSIANIKCILFDEDGNILDRTGSIAYDDTRVIRVRLHGHGDGMCGCYESTEPEPEVDVIWKLRYVGEDKFETTEIINDTNIVTRLYSVADEITLISRASPNGTLPPSMDINALPMSQAYSACDLLAKTKNLHFDYEDVLSYCTSYFRQNMLYPFIINNPQAVFQWICEHKEDKTVQDAILKCYQRTKELGRPSKLTLDFLRENILKLKDKKTQEYLLKMEVFREDSESQEK